MTRKKNKSGSSDLSGDVQRIMIILIALAVLAIACCIVYVLALAITYWYISLPALACIGYAYMRSREIPVVPAPQIKTIQSVEEIKTAHGAKTITTHETYRQEKNDLLRILLPAIK